MSAGGHLEDVDSPEDWTARYEDLRHQALSESGWASRSWGLALFTGRGLMAWLRAWPQRAVPVQRRPTPASADGPGLPSHLHQQVTWVLADMILNGWRVSPTALEATA